MKIERRTFPAGMGAYQTRWVCCNCHQKKTSHDALKPNTQITLTMQFGNVFQTRNICLDEAALCSRARPRSAERDQFHIGGEP